MAGRIREGASSTRSSLLDGSNYAFWKARMRAYLKANDERLSRFLSKAHKHHELEIHTCNDGEEMAMIVRKFKKFLKGKRPDGRFKGTNAKKDFVPKKFDNDKGKGKGVQCYECQGFGHIASK
ncbi:hypothetical protein ACOSP7_013229 [Xanthoceras sorbifolium]